MNKRNLLENRISSQPLINGNTPNIVNVAPTSHTKPIALTPNLSTFAIPRFDIDFKIPPGLMNNLPLPPELQTNLPSFPILPPLPQIPGIIPPSLPPIISIPTPSQYIYPYSLPTIINNHNHNNHRQHKQSYNSNTNKVRTRTTTTTKPTKTTKSKRKRKNKKKQETDNEEYIGISEEKEEERKEEIDINELPLGHPGRICFEDTISEAFTDKYKNQKRYVAHRTWARPKKCTLCNTTYPSADDYELHRMVYHSEGIQIDHPCPICGSSYNERRWLNRHVRNCHFKFICKIDGHGIDHKGTPNAKLKKKKGKKAKPTDVDNICGFRFAQYDDLQAHQAIIHGVINDFVQHSGDQGPTIQFMNGTDAKDIVIERLVWKQIETIKLKENKNGIKDIECKQERDDDDNDDNDDGMSNFDDDDLKMDISDITKTLKYEDEKKKNNKKKKRKSSSVKSSKKKKKKEKKSSKKKKCSKRKKGKKRKKEKKDMDKLIDLSIEQEPSSKKRKLNNYVNVNENHNIQ